MSIGAPIYIGLLRLWVGLTSVNLPTSAITPAVCGGTEGSANGCLVPESANAYCNRLMIIARWKQCSSSFQTIEFPSLHHQWQVLLHVVVAVEAGTLSACIGHEHCCIAIVCISTSRFA